VTIRQDDLDIAVGDAIRVAGVVGLLAGNGIGLSLNHLAGTGLPIPAAVVGAAAGAVSGGLAGKALAVWSRGRAAALVLEGNRTVLEDIGAQTARYLETVSRGAGLEAFLAGLRPGPSEEGGQDRLRAAFLLYDEARRATHTAARRRAMVEANQLIVYHEHVRLDPYIRRAMPFIVRRCATQRLMTYEVGDRVLTVGEDVPGGHGTAARDWSDIRDRMRYVFALFDRFHEDAEVFDPPFPEAEMAAIAAGRKPQRFAGA
jgi:hypothetical protein